MPGRRLLTSKRVGFKRKNYGSRKKTFASRKRKLRKSVVSRKRGLRRVVKRKRKPAWSVKLLATYKRLSVPRYIWRENIISNVTITDRYGVVGSNHASDTGITSVTIGVAEMNSILLSYLAWYNQTQPVQDNTTVNSSVFQPGQKIFMHNFRERLSFVNRNNFPVIMKIWRLRPHSDLAVNSVIFYGQSSTTIDPLPVNLLVAASKQIEQTTTNSNTLQTGPDRLYHRDMRPTDYPLLGQYWHVYVKKRVKIMPGKTFVLTTKHPDMRLDDNTSCNIATYTATKKTRSTLIQWMGDLADYTGGAITGLAYTLPQLSIVSDRTCDVYGLRQVNPFIGQFNTGGLSATIAGSGSAAQIITDHNSVVAAAAAA